MYESSLSTGNISLNKIYYMYNKLCENTKNCKSAYPGSKKKLYMGPVNKNPKEKIQNLIFKYAKLDVCEKNF